MQARSGAAHWATRGSMAPRLGALALAVAFALTAGAAPAAAASVTSEKSTYTCGERVNVTLNGDSNAQAALQVNDPNATAYLYASVPTDSFGNGAFNFTLGANASAGNYTVSVSFASGGPFTSVFEVTCGEPVPPPPDTQAPRAVIDGPRTVDPNTSVRFSGANSSDDSGTIANYTWEFEGSGPGNSSYTPNVTHAWALKGDYTVTLTVRDASGNSNRSSIDVHVRDIMAPTAVIAALATVEKGTSLTLDGSGSFDDGGSPVANWTWGIDFENGTQVLYGDHAAFTWFAAGSYAATLTVKDGEGNLGQSSVTVIVTNPPTRPGPGETPWVIIALGAVIAVGLGGSLATSRGMFALGALFAVFARIKRDDVRGQETRKKILGFIEKNPGKNYNGIRRALDMPNGTCAYHLQVLERGGEVRREPNGFSVHFFLADAPESVAGTLALPPVDLEILRALVEKRELSAAQVVEALHGVGHDVDASTASYHLRTLQRKHHLLESRREGDVAFYSVPYEKADAVTRLLSRAEETASSTVVMPALGPVTEDGTRIYGEGTDEHEAVPSAGSESSAPRPTASLEARAAADFTAGFARLRVALRTGPTEPVKDVRVELEFDHETLVLDHFSPAVQVQGGRITLGRMEKGETKQLEVFFEPQVCKQFAVEGILRYRTADGRLEVEKLAPQSFEVAVPSFEGTKNLSLSGLRQLVAGELKVSGARVLRFPMEASAAAVAEVVREAVADRELRPVRDFAQAAPYRSESWFYGVAARGGKRVVVRISVHEGGMVEVSVIGEGEADVASTLCASTEEIRKRAPTGAGGWTLEREAAAEPAGRGRRTMFDEHWDSLSNPRRGE